MTVSALLEDGKCEGVLLGIGMVDSYADNGRPNPVCSDCPDNFTFALSGSVLSLSLDTSQIDIGPETVARNGLLRKETVLVFANGDILIFCRPKL